MRKNQNTRLAIASLGALCLLSSCTLEEDNTTPYWSTKYTVEMTNNTTGATEKRTATLMVWFRNGRTEGVVETGIVGMFAGNRRIFEARWDGDADFGLYRGEGEDAILVFTGNLEGDKMYLSSTDEENNTTTYILQKSK